MFRRTFDSICGVILRSRLIRDESQGIFTDYRLILTCSLLLPLRDLLAAEKFVAGVPAAVNPSTFASCQHAPV